MNVINMYNNSTHFCKKPTLEILKLWKSRKQSARSNAMSPPVLAKVPLIPIPLRVLLEKPNKKNKKQNPKERADREDLKITVCIRTSLDRARAPIDHVLT